MQVLPNAVPIVSPKPTVLQLGVPLAGVSLQATRGNMSIFPTFEHWANLKSTAQPANFFVCRSRTFRKRAIFSRVKKCWYRTGRDSQIECSRSTFRQALCGQGSSSEFGKDRNFRLKAVHPPFPRRTRRGPSPRTTQKILKKNRIFHFEKKGTL